MSGTDADPATCAVLRLFRATSTPVAAVAAAAAAIAPVAASVAAAAAVRPPPRHLIAVSHPAAASRSRRSPGAVQYQLANIYAGRRFHSDGADPRPIPHTAVYRSG